PRGEDVPEISDGKRRDGRAADQGLPAVGGEAVSELRRGHHFAAGRARPRRKLGHDEAEVEPLVPHFGEETSAELLLAEAGLRAEDEVADVAARPADEARTAVPVRAGDAFSRR